MHKGNTISTISSIITTVILFAGLVFRSDSTRAGINDFIIGHKNTNLSINCILKDRAAWWLLAQLAGWEWVNEETL